MDFTLFSREIEKTGFVLENRVASTLKRAGWTVISNKYYIDDVEESVREIDLLAYRVTKVQHFEVYTVLVVSCKKSDENAWALLARNINLKDPNSDWWPLHAWSNDKALTYQLGISGKARNYHDALSILGVKDALSVPDVEVFAFQEMNKKSGKPQNDKPIHGAITSLIKAQAYELSALPRRKKAPSIYQFNLLSVVDTDMVRLMFDGTSIESSPIDTEHYLARYIVNKREIFSRIRFIKSDVFDRVIEDYGRLHEANCKWLASECDKFYLNIEADYSRMEVLSEEFVNTIKWMTWRIQRRIANQIELRPPSFFYDKEKNQLNISFIDLPDEALDFMNSDEGIGKMTAETLRKIYRYSGDFVFSDIPF